MSHHVVEVRDLAYAYPDGTQALNGVSFRVEHGEAVALVGANGAGKSTLLLHLIGYLPVARGEVRIGEVPLTRETASTIRRAVGMVFQDPDDQLFMPTVGEDVAFGPLNLRLPPTDVEQRVASALERVGMSHRRTVSTVAAQIGWAEVPRSRSAKKRWESSASATLRSLVDFAPIESTISSA